YTPCIRRLQCLGNGRQRPCVPVAGGSLTVAILGCSAICRSASGSRTPAVSRRALDGTRRPQSYHWRGRLPGRAGWSPPGPPTDPDVRHARIRFLKPSRCYPCKDTLAPQSTGLLWSGLVSSASLPCVRPADALLDGAFPPVGRLGLTSPPSSVLCAATTATSPSRGPSLVARSPIPCLLPSFLVSPTRFCP